MRQVLLFALFLFVLGCQEITHTAPLHASVANIVTPEEITGEFSPLEFYFKEDSKGVINSNLEIPFSVIEKITREKISTEFIKSIHPRSYTFNDHGHFFITEYRCSAGDNCALYFLLHFDWNGTFVSNRQIGRETGEYGELILFQYKQVNPDTLRTYQIRYDEAGQKGVDTVVKNIYLRSLEDELKLMLDSVMAE